MQEKIKLGITCGDINGIGLETVFKTFSDSRMLEICTPILFSSLRIASFYKKVLRFQDIPLHVCNTISDVQEKKLNIISPWEEDILVTFGEANLLGGTAAFKSLVLATDLLAKKEIDVLVTSPIDKKNIQQAGFQFLGHTEYLAHCFEAEPLMLMVGERLKIALATEHTPLSNVHNVLNKEKLAQKLDILHQTLEKDFTILKPKIAVLGLNPHAGDSGAIGKEEQEIILPAVEELREKGLLVFGPYSADGFFGAGTFMQFDAVMAMYHDQGLIPFKTLEFSTGVNYTAGLPVIRTSPDHGTAFEIAGQNKADEQSFRSAVYLACDIFEHRTRNTIFTENPLQAKLQTIEKNA